MTKAREDQGPRLGYAGSKDASSPSSARNSASSQRENVGSSGISPFLVERTACTAAAHIIVGVGWM